MPQQLMRRFLMAARLGFVGALVLGLGGLFGWWTMGSTAVLVVHIVFGAVFALAIWSAAAITRGRGRQGLMAGSLIADLAVVLAVLELVNGRMPIPVILHPVLMVLALGFAEMGAARERKAAAGG